MKRKLLAMLLALALCVGMLPAAVLAEDADADPAAGDTAAVIYKTERMDNIVFFDIQQIY